MIRIVYDVFSCLKRSILHVIGNSNLLTQGAVLADCRSGLHVREVPDLGSGSDGNVVVYYAGGVEVIIHSESSFEIILEIFL